MLDDKKGNNYYICAIKPVPDHMVGGSAAALQSASRYLDSNYHVLSVSEIGVFNFLRKLFFISGKSIIVHDIYTFFILTLIFKCPSICIHTQGSIVLERGYTYLNPKYFVIKFLEFYAYTFSYVLIFPSVGGHINFFNSLIFSFCIAKRNIKLLPGVVETLAINNKLHDKEFNFDVLPVKVLTISTLTPEKNVSQGFHVLGDCFPSNLRIEWTIVGRGVEESDIRDLISKYNSSFFTINLVTNWIDEKQKQLYFDNSHFYLGTHKLAVFDRAIAESMSYGCIPVLSKVEGNLDFQFDSNVIWLSDFKSYLNSSDSLCSMSQRNAELFYENFSVNNLIKQYRNILE